MLQKIRPNVCSAVSPINLLAKSLGVLPYSLKPIEGKWTPYTTKRDGIYTLVYVIIYMVLMVHTLQIVNFEEQEENPLVPRYTIIIESAMMVVLMFTFIIFGYIFRKFTIKTLKRLCVIDNTLETVKITMDYKGMEKWIYTKIAYIVVSAIIRVFLMVNIMDIDILQQLLLMFTAFVKSVAKNQFVILVVQIRDRYEQINESIRSMFMYKSSYLQVNNNDVIRKITKMLYVLCRIHYKLRKIVQNIITAYSIQLLAYLGVALSNIIFQSYFLYALITSNKNMMTFFYLSSTITWLCDEIFELYTLVKTCSMTCNIVNNNKTMTAFLFNFNSFKFF